MNKNIMEKTGFKKEVEQVEKGNCPFCGKKVNQDEFKDELSKTEFKISGLCQKCQDKTFG